MIGTINQKKEGALSAFNTRNRNIDSEVLDDENDPYIREQDNYFDEEDGDKSELNKKALRTLNAINKGSDEGSETGNIDEITFYDFDDQTMD